MWSLMPSQHGIMCHATTFQQDISLKSGSLQSNYISHSHRCQSRFSSQLSDNFKDFGATPLLGCIPHRKSQEVTTDNLGAAVVDELLPQSQYHFLWANLRGKAEMTLSTDSMKLSQEFWYAWGKSAPTVEIQEYSPKANCGGSRVFQEVHIRSVTQYNQRRKGKRPEGILVCLVVDVLYKRSTDVKSG